MKQTRRFLAVLLTLLMLLTTMPLSLLQSSAATNATKITFPLPTSQVWYGSTYVGHGGKNKSAYSSMDITLKNGKSAEGYNVYAVADGTVINDTYKTSNGQITIKHTAKLVTTYGATFSSWYSSYCHMKNITVSKGSTVKAGQKIGQVSSVGNATGPHLHVSISSADDSTSWYQEKSTDYAISPYYIYGFVDANGNDTSYFIRDKSGKAVTSCLINHKPMGKEPINTPTWYNYKNPTLTENDARVEAEVKFSKTVTFSECGFYLAKGDAALQKVSKHDTVTTDKTGTYRWLGYTMSAYYGKLEKNTTYRYQFYVIADGKEYKSDVKSFTTKPSTSPTTWYNYKVPTLTENDARVEAEVKFNKTVTFSECGFYLAKGDAALQKVSKHDTVTTDKTGTYRWMGYTMTTYYGKLAANTTYRYQFYTIADGKEYKSDVKSFTTKDHSWNAGSVTTTPTCTTDGVKTYTCTVCNATKTEMIEATGHDYGAWMKLNNEQHQRVCANDPNHTEKATHTWGNGVAVYANEITFTCTACGATKTEITVPEALDTANITRTPVYFYANGTQQQPTVTVKNAAGETLKEGTDYTVTYPTSVEVGTYMVQVNGINGYTKTIRKTYTIKPVEELVAANVTRTPTVFYANGKQQQPTVTVKNAAGKVLTEGVDYTVTYPTSIEAGSYMVRVDGINGYKKTIRKAYTIKPAKEALDASRITRTPTSFVANGTQQQPTVIVLNAAGEALTEGVDYKVTYPTSVEIGSYMVRVDGINGYSGTVRKAYTIK